MFFGCFRKDGAKVKSLEIKTKKAALEYGGFSINEKIKKLLRFQEFAGNVDPIG